MAVAIQRPHDPLHHPNLLERRASTASDHMKDPSSSESPRPDETSAPSKKRKRPRREPDHKHVCEHPGCGKSYSRAEHLGRHQLNHQPKEIFHCKYPNCQRTFVRQDLCLRHEERHSVRGTLDVVPGKPAGAFRMAAHSVSDVRSSSSRASTGYLELHSHQRSASDPSEQQQSQPPLPSSDALSNLSPDSAPRSDLFHNAALATLSSVTENARTTPSFSMPSFANSLSRDRAQSSGTSYAPDLSSQLPPPPPPSFTLPHSHPHPFPRPSETTLLRSPAWSDTSSRPPDLQPLPPAVVARPNAPQLDRSVSAQVDPQYVPMSSAIENTELDRCAFPDDTTAWLFGLEQNFDQNMLDSAGVFTTFDGANLSDVTELSPAFLNEFGPIHASRRSSHSPHPMSISSIVDFGKSQPESNMSEERRRALVDMINEKFDETDQCPGTRPKAEFLQGDQSQQHHPLSLGMMQTYLGSYWTHFHPQMPILHKPTFSADHAPDLLIISMLVLGASCLERVHGFQVTQTCAELACFLAWHLRWAIFKHPDFRPPANLWIFQSLILLEYYEKMYATKRTMHERAHIHHGTTLTLMRRGSFLAGKSAVDPDQTANANDVQLYGRARKPMAPVDSWWHNWAVKEATRRAVLGAFVMDTTHAILFGHAAVMAVHEMRLPLPCDESLWGNANGAEVARAEAELRTRDEKRPMFLDCLKQTLNGQKVVTNIFGRTILMTGLLSVSWHMSQRDIHISSLGVAPSLGGKENWKTSLKRAFNTWKRDFDESLSETNAQTHHEHEASIVESRVVLHHLAHMSLHSDIVDAQIFAGAPSQLGRRVNPQDRVAAERRIRDAWAPSSRARESTYHALQFLRKVLTPEDIDEFDRSLPPHQPPTKFDYSAREDDLLNRPWMVFYAALLVWCYAYALEGPIRSSEYSVNRVTKITDMRLYLRRVGGVAAPEDLRAVRKRNHCIGLLMTLRDLFIDTRWQLLHEASRMLENCIDMLSGKERPELTAGLPPGD